MRSWLCGTLILGVIWSVAFGGDNAAAIRKELRFLHHDGIRRANEEAQYWSLTSKDGAKFGGPGTKEQLILDLGADGTGTMRTPKGIWEVKVTIDPTKKPKTMDIEYQSGPHKDKKQFAIYKFEKTQLILLATTPGAAEKDRPQAFDKRDAKTTTLLVFNREHTFVIE